MRIGRMQAPIVTLCCLALLVVGTVSACGGEDDSETTSATGGTQTIAPNGGNSGGSGTDFSLTSSDFADDSPMPVVSTCIDLGGSNASPRLTWQAAPAETAGYALIMDDEDPPCGTGDDACRHWAVYNIPVIVTSLNSAQDINQIGGAAQGQNYAGINGYAGPCPPDTHAYRFTIYALESTMPDIPEGTPLTRSQFENEYGEHIIASDTLTGSYTP